MKCNINMCVGGRPPIKTAKIDETIKEAPPEEEKLAEEEPKPSTSSKTSTSSNFLTPNAGLDIIVEETSDLSDLEANKKLATIPKPPRKKKRANILQRLFHQNKQEPTECVLVDAKIMQSMSPPEESRSVCKTETLDREMEVEVVNLETISNASDDDDEDHQDDNVIESQDIPTVIPLSDNNNQNNDSDNPLEDNELVKNDNYDYSEIENVFFNNLIEHELVVEEDNYDYSEVQYTFSGPYEKDNYNENEGESVFNPLEGDELVKNVNYNENNVENVFNPLEGDELVENQNEEKVVILLEGDELVENQNKEKVVIPLEGDELVENEYSNENVCNPLKENELVKNPSSDSNKTFIYIDEEDNIDEYNENDYLNESIGAQEEEEESEKREEEKVLLNIDGENGDEVDDQQKQHAENDDGGKSEQSPSGTEENSVENRGDQCVECNKMKDQRENAENSRENEAAMINLVPITVEKPKKNQIISENENENEKSVLYKYLNENINKYQSQDDGDVDQNQNNNNNNENNNLNLPKTSKMSNFANHNNNIIVTEDSVIYAKVEQNEKCDENVKIEPNSNENVSQENEENDEIIRNEFGRIEVEIEKLQEDLRILGLQHEVVKEITYKISQQNDYVELKQEKSIVDREIPQEIEKVSDNLNPIPPKSENLSIDNVTYTEWQKKIEERQERKQQKVIKITQTGANKIKNSYNGNNGNNNDDKVSDEFLRKVKEKRRKYKIPGDPDYENDLDEQEIPKHLTEFLEFGENNSASQTSEEEQKNKNVPFKVVIIGKDNRPIKSPERPAKEGVWSPQNRSIESLNTACDPQSPPPPTAPLQPVWTPKSAPASPLPERREFRKIGFESPTPTRKLPPRPTDRTDSQIAPPWTQPGYDKPPTNFTRLQTSSSLPSIPDSQKSRAPPNVPVNLSQRASSKTDGLVARAVSSIESENGKNNGSDSQVKPNEIIYTIKNEYVSEPETDHERPRKMTQLSPKKFEGIGPTTKEGMPLTLRSEVDENNQSKWYKKMYNTIHKAHDDGKYPYKSSGYLTDPEPTYDSDYTIKYSTLDRRRTPSALKPNSYNKFNTIESEPTIKSGATPYKNQPGRIENYTPGHSSISDKECKQQLEQQKLTNNKATYSEGNLSRALKDADYDSDSTLVFRKKEPAPASTLSPVEQKQYYKKMQHGGEPPIQGFRKLAPEKPKVEPRRYIEDNVNIHYKTPIRYEYKDAIPDDELAYRQAEQMRKIYEEERRRKYMHELEDLASRRHADNLPPSQKSPIPINRYEDFEADLAPKQVQVPKTIAKALYSFHGQTNRELSFKKGDIIYIRRQIDKNWYEGEHNACVGLLPANYIEIITKDGVKQTPPKKSRDGKARAKFNFTAQTSLELSLLKGELVTLTRRVDDNWFEGRIGANKGIFPVSYVEVLEDIGSEGLELESVNKPILASHTLMTSYDDSINNGHVSPANGIIRETKTIRKTEVLHVDTSNEPIGYKAMYNYRPQNADELELLEGDSVFVLEKCDDGWFVGTSQRTGCFGTFPGNYVKKM